MAKDSNEDDGSDQVSAAVKRIAGCPASPAYVSAYFTGPKFAREDFDAMGDNPPFQFSHADLLALNLLDVSLGPPQIRTLMSGRFDDLLRAVPVDVELWSPVMEVGGTVWNHALALYSEISTVKGLGRTKTSKLLARKRPRLIPIQDSVIEAELSVKETFWAPLRDSLLDDDVRKKISDFAPSTGVTVLRKLDVAVWMHGSQSKNAKEVRSSLAGGVRCTCRD